MRIARDKPSPDRPNLLLHATMMQSTSARRASRVQPWVKSVLLVIVAMALVAGVGIVATPLAKPAPEQAPLRTTIADEVLEATGGAQVGEIATATIGPANQDAAADYFEARVFKATDSKPEWSNRELGTGKRARWPGTVQREGLRHEVALAALGRVSLLRRQRIARGRDPFRRRHHARPLAREERRGDTAVACRFRSGRCGRLVLVLSFIYD